MRVRGLLALALAVGAASTFGGCGELKTGIAPAGQDGGTPAEGEDTSGLEDGGAEGRKDSSVKPDLSSVKVPIENDTLIAGSLSIASDADGRVSLAWLDTPSAQRHLHVALVAGDENPPRVIVTSDTALESNAISLGQAVSTFAPSKGCFGLVWGQAGMLNVAKISGDAKPGPSSVLATMSEGPIARLSQVRTAVGAGNDVLVAWSEVARFNGDATGTFHSASLRFAGCTPGTTTIDDVPLAEGLPHQSAPAGAPEVAVAHADGAFHAAFQRTSGGSVLGTIHRTRGAGDWSSATTVDAGGTVSAGGSIGVTGAAGATVFAYYRRTSDTLADLVVTTIGPGASRKETVLETGILAGMSAATSLEAARLAIAHRPLLGPVIAAVFARDAQTSELRIYRADKTAPNGFRSELFDTNVFGPKGGGDAHPLVDVATDGSDRIHVAWRSGATKHLTYARLEP